MARDFSSIPLLDLERSGDPSTKTGLLVDLRNALLGVGFAYVENHGVPQDVTADIEGLLPKLFALSDLQKNEVALVNSPHFLGYSNFGSEVTAKTRDEREQFEFGTELLDIYEASQGREALYRRLHGPNQWPRFPAGCRSIVETYASALADLSLRFLQLAAESLSLPRDAFLPFVSKQHRVKLVHYRPLQTSSGPSGATQGVGPHKDSSGWLTFLTQASDPSVKGLQALNKVGQWIDVPPIPGTFVVNMGQAFEVVTNGVCKATTHRVLLPPGDYHRYSIPFFQGVRLDLTKDEFKTLWKHFEPEKWQTQESKEGQQIDSPFLRGNYNTWGESQLRTKIRSHQDVGRKFYADVFDSYVHEDTYLTAMGISVAYQQFSLSPVLLCYVHLRYSIQCQRSGCTLSLDLLLSWLRLPCCRTLSRLSASSPHPLSSPCIKIFGFLASHESQNLSKGQRRP